MSRGAAASVRPKRPRRRKAGAKSTAAAPKPWLIPLAVILLAAAGYAFYYLDNLPQAGPIDPDAIWSTKTGERMRLNGLTAGPLLELHARRPVSATLSFDRGTWVGDPTLGRHDEEKAAPFALALNVIESESATIGIRLLDAPADAPITLNVVPRLRQGNFFELSLVSEGAPMAVDVSLGLSDRADEHSVVQIGDRPIEPPTIIVPAGKRFRIGMVTEDLPAFAAQIGRYGEEEELEDLGPRLELSSVEIGSNLSETFERNRLACGSAPRILWQRLLPGVDLTDCGTGRIAAVDLKLEPERVNLGVAGTGFTVQEGTTRVWEGFRHFRQNDIVKGVLGTLVAGLIGWAFVVIRRRAGAP